MTECLGRIENFAPDQTIRFGSLEYTAEPRGDLTLSGWALDRLDPPVDSKVLTSDPISNPHARLSVTSEPTSSLDPSSHESYHALILADAHSEAVPRASLSLLQIDPTDYKEIGHVDLSLLNDMLDQIQSLFILDG